MITLYTKPCPVNQKYGIINGRNLLTKKYRDAKEALAWEIRSQWKKQPIGGDVVINIIEYFGDNRRRDIDAYLKVILDAGSGILYGDDSQIVELTVIKAKDLKNPRIEISVV
jgi:Holliday junction resolvase RusA-like endonuclease